MDNSELEPFLSEEEIREIVRKIAFDMQKDYKGGEPPLLVGVLKGSFMFLADLSRELYRLGVCLEIDFLQTSSYKGTESAGEVRIEECIKTPMAGRNVVIVEDIADTSITLRGVEGHVSSDKPASLRTCALLVREGCEVMPDYFGLEVPRGFVAGYGIDFNEKHREKPWIGVVPGTR